MPLTIEVNVKVKTKQSFPLPRNDRDREQWKIQLHSFVTSVLDWNEWLGSRPGHGKNPSTLEQVARWAAGPVLTFRGEKKSFFPTGIRTPSSPQPSRYIN